MQKAHRVLSGKTRLAQLRLLNWIVNSLESLDTTVEQKARDGGAGGTDKQASCLM